MAISVLSHSSLIAGRRLKHRRVSTGWATPIATNSRLLLFTPCLSGWLPITLLGESTYHCRASRKWVLRHAPRDRGQS
jgi:hypothetical protein